MAYNLKNKAKAVDYKFSADFAKGKQKQAGLSAESKLDANDLSLISMFMDSRHKQFKNENGREVFAKHVKDKNFTKEFGLPIESDSINEIATERFKQLFETGNLEKAAAFMSVIIEKDLPLVMDYPAFNRFVKFVNVGWKEKYEMVAKFNSVAKVVKKAESNAWTADKQTLFKGGRTEIETARYEAKAAVEYIDVLTGVATLNDVVDYVNGGFEANIKELVYNAITDNFVASSATYSTNTNDLKVVRTMINKVKTDRRNAGYSQIVMFGSSEAFNQLTLQSDTGSNTYNSLFTDSQKSELMEKGYISNLLGAEAFITDQWLDEDGTFPVNSDKIRIMAVNSKDPEFVHIVTRGESITKLVDKPQDDENMQLSFERHDYLGAGALLSPVIAEITVSGVEIDLVP